MYEYKATLIRVIDGDTVDFAVDLGFNIQFTERFRLKGINAPETRTRDLDEKKKGYTSKFWLMSELESNLNDIVIKTDLDKKGKYGRYLAEIFINDVNINEKMIRLNLAERYM